MTDDRLLALASPGPVGQGVRSRICPVCNSAGGRELMRHGPWRLVRCQGCRLAYLPEIPADFAVEGDMEWSASFDRERADRWVHHPIMRSWTAMVNWVRPPRELRALRRILKWRKAGRLLDVGCGDGRFAAAAQQAGFDVIGNEVSPQMTKKAASRIGAERVIRARLEQCDLPLESFDVVTTISYLEHDPRPHPTCLRIFNLLRPGGLCIHKVPNHGCVNRKILGTRWSGYRWPEHVQYFSPPSLSRLMTDCGFEVLRIHANPFSDNMWLAAQKPKRDGLPFSKL